MSIGENIRAIRKRQGINAEYIAEKLGISPSTIYRYEKGDIEKVDSTLIPKIAEILNTTPAAIMGWEDDKSVKHKEKEQPSITERLSDKELEFIRDFSALTPSNRRILFALSKILLQEQSGHPEDQD